MRRNKEKSPSTKTVERKAAEEMLELPRTVKIGKRTYKVPKHTYATIMLMSAEISELPKTIAESDEDAMHRTIRYAKDYGGVPRVLAILLCPSILTMFGCIGNFLYRRRVKRKATRLKALYSPKELNLAARMLIDEEQIAYFFLLSTFLLGLNVTKPTRKVETTAHGQQ